MVPRETTAFCQSLNFRWTRCTVHQISARTALRPPPSRLKRCQKQVDSKLQPDRHHGHTKISCKQEQEKQGVSKSLAYAAAAIILAAAPFAGVSAPPPALSSQLNSAPLRFSQSLLKDDGEAPVKLQPQWDVKSMNSKAETILMFSNDSDSVVDLWWIDYFGHEVYYATINPGTTHMQPSYATHPWVVRDHISQNSVLVVVAGTEPALAVVQSV
ncbi:unnamed protein product [Chondrus crispus]|uniref:von Hippel-Lindau disease tumour suppressor beta domain-containing protein n=1 Tax=Chondrus crispus TaxID=2769 RepID=R7QD13_CHOCR|nr:unnamed protein product [Chondrus crispus]CDF35663.1 unnamed protein product [Chondrus crispus]|eukprot:XP_005715482.1 unnamed protein product [Chondrus crispus]